MEWKIKDSLCGRIENTINEIAEEISYLKVYSKSAFIRISYEGEITLLEIDFGIHSNYWDLDSHTENRVREIIDGVCDRSSVRVGNSHGQSLISNKEELRKDFLPFVELTLRNDYVELGYGYKDGSMSKEIFERINDIAFTLGKDLKDSGKRVKVRLSPTALD